MSNKTIKQVEKEIELMEMQYGMDTHQVTRAHQNVNDSFLKLTALRRELSELQDTMAGEAYKRPRYDFRRGGPN